MCSWVTAPKTNTHEDSLKQIMNNQKQIVTRWYGAFEKNNPTILDEVLAKDWRDIPPAPEQPPGPEGAKQQERVVLVTGAGSGIGREAAQAFE